MCLWFQLVFTLHYTSSLPGFCMINTSLDSFGACSAQLTNRKNCIFNLVYFLSNTESCCVHFSKQRHVPGCLDSILTSFSPEWLGKSGVVKGTTNCKGCLCSSAARRDKLTSLCHFLHTNPLTASPHLNTLPPSPIIFCFLL